MALFSYKGIDKLGKDRKNSINAENINQAKNKLRNSGIMLSYIKEEKSGNNFGININFNNSVSINDLSLMTRQLATLIKAKIQIVESFTALIEQSENPKLKIVLSEIKQKVNEGSSLANAFSNYPSIFNNIYVNMVEAGESSGTLDLVLIRLAEFTESQVRLRNKIKGAMIYPVIMLGVSGVVLSVILIFVIPKITRIFITMKKELPLPTQICIALSNFLKGYWWAVIIGGIIVMFLFKKWKRTTSGKSTVDSILLKLPIVGNLVTMVNVSRFCSTLATLLSSGVPILGAMKIVKNLISNVHMQDAIENSKVSISEGSSLTGPLAESQLFPVMVTHMMSLGEKSGELGSMLEIIADNYEEQIEVKLNGLTSTLEPIMMIGMGLAVAFIVVSVVVPMMELNSI